MKAHVFDKLPRSTLGEGPLWDVETQTFYWVDIVGQKVHRYDPKTFAYDYTPTDSTVGFMVIDKGGKMIVGLRDGIYRMDFGSKEKSLIAKPESMNPENRFNEGQCDRFGRLWAGTMHCVPDERRAPTGSFYRLAGDKLIEIEKDVHISNGMGWSLDNRTMYYIDTFTHSIFKYDYDPDTGEAANRRIFVEIPRDQGNPDGMTVDSQGRVVCAMWGGSRINIYTPDGKLDEVISVPMPQPSSVAFGGPDFKTLYITTATFDMTSEQVAAAPLSGLLCAVEMSVPGLPETRFAKAA